jgi:hypothetical protein
LRNYFFFGIVAPASRASISLSPLPLHPDTKNLQSEGHPRGHMIASNSAMENRAASVLKKAVTPA